MPSNADFFATRNPQAVLKHGILTRYAYYFASRAGKATGGRVAFIDGYAGEGRYEDGNPGSPLLLASQAERLQFLNRDVKLAFVEPNAVCRAKLETSLAAHAVAPDLIVPEPLERVALDLLSRYANRAVFLFVDPFGLGIAHRTLVTILKRSTRLQPVDVLYHFSVSTVARMGRAGVQKGTSAEQNARRLDETLGPVDWRSPFEMVDDGGATATQMAVAVAHNFGEAIRRETGVRSTSIPVRRELGHQPIYLLTLFSADPSGKAHWDFADQASKAHVDWLLHCDVTAFEANMRREESRGVAQLLPPERPRKETIESGLSRSSADFLDSHLPEVLRSHRQLRPVDHIPELYGTMLGRAGAKHLRAALRRLHASGRIDDPCTGDFWRRLLCWTD